MMSPKPGCAIEMLSVWSVKTYSISSVQLIIKRLFNVAAFMFQ